MYFIHVRQLAFPDESDLFLRTAEPDWPSTYINLLSAQCRIDYCREKFAKCRLVCMSAAFVLNISNSLAYNLKNGSIFD